MQYKSHFVYSCLSLGENHSAGYHFHVTFGRVSVLDSGAAMSTAEHISSQHCSSSMSFHRYLLNQFPYCGFIWSDNCLLLNASIAPPIYFEGLWYPKFEMKIILNADTCTNTSLSCLNKTLPRCKLWTSHWKYLQRRLLPAKQWQGLPLWGRRR